MYIFRKFRTTKTWLANPSAWMHVLYVNSVNVYIHSTYPAAGGTHVYSRTKDVPERTFCRYSDIHTPYVCLRSAWLHGSWAWFGTEFTMEIKLDGVEKPTCISIILRRDHREYPHLLPKQVKRFIYTNFYYMAKIETCQITISQYQISQRQ